MAASLIQTLRRMRRTLRQEFVGQLHVSPHLVQRQLVRRASGLGVVEVKPQPGDEIEGLCKVGQLDKAVQVLLRMNEQGSIPSVQIYRRILKACSVTKALAQVKRVQGHLTRHPLGSNRFLGEYLVTVLVKCGGLEDALQVFYTLPHRTVVSWTAVISGYSMSRNCHECLRMYQSMLAEGVWPDSYTFVSLLKACGNLKNLEEGPGRESSGALCEYARGRCEPK